MGSSDRQLVLRFENDIEDIEEWVDTHYRRSPITRRHIRHAQVRMILLALLILVLAPELWMVGLVAAPLIAVMPRIFYAQSRRSVRELYLEDGSPQGVGKHEVRASAEGLEVVREESRHFYRWSLINKVVHGRNHTFIYVGSINAIVIPHRDTDALRREQLIDRIRHALPASPRTAPLGALPDGQI